MAIGFGCSYVCLPKLLTLSINRRSIAARSIHRTSHTQTNPGKESAVHDYRSAQNKSSISLLEWKEERSQSQQTYLYCRNGNIKGKAKASASNIHTVPISIQTGLHSEQSRHFPLLLSHKFTGNDVDSRPFAKTGLVSIEVGDVSMGMKNEVFCRKWPSSFLA